MCMHQLLPTACHGVGLGRPAVVRDGERPRLIVSMLHDGRGYAQRIDRYRLDDRVSTGTLIAHPDADAVMETVPVPVCELVLNVTLTFFGTFGVTTTEDCTEQPIPSVPEQERLNVLFGPGGSSS